MVDLDRRPGGERPRAFGEGADGEQHPAHVGVDEDRIGLLVGVLGAGERAPLQPLAGERRPPPGRRPRRAPAPARRRAAARRS